jgi:hypothetical protein
MSKKLTRKRRTPRLTDDRKRRQEDWQRRMAGFEGLCHEAARRNPWPLCDYFLKGGPLTLSEQEAGLVAWLLAKLT